MKILTCKFFYFLNVLFILFNSLNLSAHNLANGGCKSHCAKNTNKNKIHYITIPTENEVKTMKESNSCLKKSLCRG